jgi:hypothetical protein
MISWFQVAIGLIGLMTGLMTWLQKKALINGEQSRILAGTLDQWAKDIRAAADARDVVRGGGGVPIDTDPDNRDRGPPGG